MPDRVLFVEDDDSLRSTIAGHLRRRGFDVVEVASAEEARQHLLGGLRPALVLLDLNLPGDTGWELLREAPLGDGSGPPVVIVSAIPVTPRQLSQHRVAGYLPKPFPLDTLLATVERLMAPGAAG